MSHLTGIRQADASCCGALLKACEGGGRWREATGMKAVKFAVDVSVVIILNYVFWCDFKAWNWWKWWKLVGILGLHVWLMKDIMPCPTRSSHFTGAELVAFASRASMAVWTYITTQLSNKPFGLSVIPPLNRTNHNVLCQVMGIVYVVYECLTVDNRELFFVSLLWLQCWCPVALMPCQPFNVVICNDSLHVIFKIYQNILSLSVQKQYHSLGFFLYNWYVMILGNSSRAHDLDTHGLCG